MRKAKKTLIFDGATGLPVQSAIPEPSPDDIPSIIERYIGLVGDVIADIERKGRDPEYKSRYQSKDINGVAAIGRSVAMLQAVEEARISRVGGKSIKELPTSQLRKLLADTEERESAEESTETED